MGFNSVFKGLIVVIFEKGQGGATRVGVIDKYCATKAYIWKRDSDSLLK